MAYTNKSVDYVYNLLIDSFQEKFNSTLRLLPKSFINVLSKVLAGVFVILYKLSGWFYLQLFPDTASFESVDILGHTIRPLIQLGNLFGVGEPNSGTAWKGTVKATVLIEGKTITLGTPLKSDKTGLLYNVSENTALSGTECEIPVYCVQSGEDGNLSEGDVLKFVSPLSSVKQETEVTGTTQAGTDEETEEHYRSRVVSGYGSRTQGGSLVDYRTWAFDVSGVLQTYIYNNERSPAGVLIYVAGDPDIYEGRIVDRNLCVAVGQACTYDPDTGKANRKPLTAILDPAGDETYTNVRSVTVTEFDVYVTEMDGALSDDFGHSAKSELETYFEGREPLIRGLDNEDNKTDLITKNSVIAVVNGVATTLKATFGTVKLELSEREVDSYTLGMGELCALGKLYINGEEYED
jgi:hypothetical protein